MKKYMSPEAQLFDFAIAEDICEMSAKESKGSAIAVDYDDGEGEI